MGTWRERKRKAERKDIFLFSYNSCTLTHCFALFLYPSEMDINSNCQLSSCQAYHIARYWTLYKMKHLTLVILATHKELAIKILTVLFYHTCLIQDNIITDLYCTAWKTLRQKTLTSCTVFFGAVMDKTAYCHVVDSQFKWYWN